MRRLICLAFLACQLSAATALAGAHDFQLHKLGSPDQSSSAYDPNANAYFRVFAGQLAAAVTSFNLMPPETLGHSGFNIGFEYAVATVDAREDFWPTESATPSRQLLMPTLHLRKGLPFSFEVGAKFSYLQLSRMAAATVEAKWALNEGFTYFPDLGVRGYATRLINARSFSLTTAGLDVGLGKQFAVGGVATLTPYGGWNLQYLTAESGSVDFRPDRPAYDPARCSDPSTLTPGSAAEQECAQNPNAHPLDSQQTPHSEMAKFSTVEFHRNYNHRFYLGLRFISYVFELTIEGSVINTVDVALADGSKVSKQIVTFGGKVGIDF